MAQDFVATETPADLVAALGLTVGTNYTVQNLSTLAKLFMRDAPTSGTLPVLGDRGFKIEAGGHGVVRAETVSTGIFVWTDDPAGCAAIVTLAA